MIELKSVWRLFQVGGHEVRALQDLSLVIEKGSYVSLMGPSGSGKSTLLNVLGLLDRPTRGQYLLDGREVGALDDVQQAAVRRKSLGFVFQSFHLVPRLTTAQNIALPLVLAEVKRSERNRRVAEQLAAFGLTDRADHLPDQLSGGQRQRCAIARATITQPELLLADEPTGNLDRATGDDVIAVLEGLNRQGITLLIVTHDPELGLRANRQLRMQDGRLVSDTRKAPVPAGVT